MHTPYLLPQYIGEHLTGLHFIYSYKIYFMFKGQKFNALLIYIKLNMITHFTADLNYIFE